MINQPVLPWVKNFAIGRFSDALLDVRLTLSLLLMTQEAYMDGVDKDLTAQNVQSEL